MVYKAGESHYLNPGFEDLAYVRYAALIEGEEVVGQAREGAYIFDA